MPIYRIQDKIILFIHIPKAGGTSVNSWLGAHAPENFYLKHRKEKLPVVPQHFHGEYINALFSPSFFDLSFCISRNPYARAVSEYNWRITRPKLRNRLLPTMPLGWWFSNNLKKYQKDKFLFSNHIRPQHEFPIDGTEVFKLEDGLEDLRHRLTEFTGLEFVDKIPKKNISAKATTRLTEKQAERIYNFYKKDFEIFGYNPDSWIDL